MLKLYFIRRQSIYNLLESELIDFGEYESLQELEEDLTSYSSHCLWGTYLIVNDVMLNLVRVTQEGINKKKIVSEWEISERVTTDEV